MLSPSSAKRGTGEEESEVQRLASLKAQPGSHHHFSDGEAYQLATFVNARFETEPLLSMILPIDANDPAAFFKAWGDGKLLTCLVDAACKGVVDLPTFRRKASKPLGVSMRHPIIHHFAVLNDALEGCKNIDGLRLGFVGAEDFVQGNRPVIMGVCWQLVRLAIYRTVNITERPELSELLTPEEAASASTGQAGLEELILARWFNQYLQAVGSDRSVWSFGPELTDGVAWCTLLNAIDPAACPPPDEHDAQANAASAIKAVHKMGVKGVFFTEESILVSDKKQNMMFCAQVMDMYPTIPSYLRAPPSTAKSGGGNFIDKTPFGSKYGSSGGSSTTAVSVYTNSRRRQHVGSSAPPPPAPSGAKSGCHVDFNSTAMLAEGKVYYDSDGDGESAPGCGLGFLGLFACLSRN